MPRTDDVYGAQEASALGDKRFDSSHLFDDAPVLVPPEPMWASAVRDLARRQLQNTHNVEALLCGYIELLSRAKSLSDFWDANVGPTDDWPISVYGETREAEECLAQRFNRLQFMVNLLDESVCG